MYMRLCKPPLGISLAATAPLILSPLLLTISVLLFYPWENPPLFLQTRVGYQGKLFNIIKFKTMTDERETHGTLLTASQQSFALGNLLRIWNGLSHPSSLPFLTLF